MVKTDGALWVSGPLKNTDKLKHSPPPRDAFESKSVAFPAQTVAGDTIMYTQSIGSRD